MTASADLLSNIVPLSPPTEIKLGDGHSVTATAKGSAQLTMHNGMTVGLSEVLLVPQLKTNLFSVKQATQSGASIQFSNNMCSISKGPVHITAASTTGGLYTFPVRSSTPSVSNSKQLWSQDEDTSSSQLEIDYMQPAAPQQQPPPVLQHPAPQQPAAPQLPPITQDEDMHAPRRHREADLPDLPVPRPVPVPGTCSTRSGRAIIKPKVYNASTGHALIAEPYSYEHTTAASPAPPQKIWTIYTPKALYSLMQAPHAWYHNLKASLQHRYTP
jgi:hypothetical protein